MWRKIQKKINSINLNQIDLNNEVKEMNSNFMARNVI